MRALIALGLMSLAAGRAAGQTSTTPDPVLPRVAVFVAPSLPRTWSTSCGEAWDCRRRAGLPVPSPELAFATDVCLIIAVDMNPNARPLSVSLSEVQAILDMYVATEAGRIRGYRPWFQKQFVMSLTSRERAQLANELLTLIHTSVSTSDCSMDQ
jgi:hypothetical protein